MGKLTTLLILFFPFSMIWACSCAGFSSPCNLSSAVVIARVIRDSGDGWGKGPGRVKVEEVLKGPRSLDEIEVETAAGTSCYGRLELGKRYVLYGGIRENGPLGFSIGSCGQSFQIGEDEYLLDALRNAARNGPFLVVGKVFAKSDAYSYSGDGISDVRVIAEGAGGKVETITDSVGYYRLLGLTPGRYRLTASHASYSQDTSREPREETDESVKKRGFEFSDPWSPSLRAGESGCEVRHLGLWPEGKISGRISGVDGKPVDGVEVGAYGVDVRGRLETRPLHSVKTNGDGDYTLNKLPAGQYVVGVNADKYADKSPFPPVAYPAARDAESGERLTLANLEERKGIDLTVQPARRPVDVKVLVTMENGSPAEKMVLMVEDSRGIQRYFKMEATNAQGLASLRLYQGAKYVIQSAKSTFVGRSLFEYTGEVGPLSFDETTASVHIVVRLKEKTPLRR